MAPKIVTNLFLSNVQLEHITKWKYKVVDNSISTKVLQPIWVLVADLVPPTVAPNCLTLAALACVLQAFWLVSHHVKEWPTVVAIVASLLTYAYFTLDAIDGMHARKTKNASPVGEIFDYFCNNINKPLQIMTFLMILGVEDPATRWYLVQAGQLFFLSLHLKAFNSNDGVIRFGLFSGPGEMLHLMIFILCLHGVFGLGFLWDWYVSALRYADSNIAQLGLPPLPKAAAAASAFMYKDGVINADAFFHKGVQIVYYIVWWGVISQIALLKQVHNNSRFGLMVCLLMRVLPAVAMEWTSLWIKTGGITLEQTLSDGMFVSIIISDIIVAKMAKRELHNLVVVMSMMSIMSNFVVYFSLVVYYGVVIADVCSYMNLPLLTPVINVYCDGVFDMLHLGHMNQFRQAIEVSGGTRLFVGVHSDAECTGYKRAPIMHEDERYAAVRACKFVHEVIEGAPMIATEEFINENNLHIYAIGEEYASNLDDKYYKVPRRLGMIKATKRSQGVSTSDIIRRVVEQRPEMLERKEAAADVKGCV